MKRKKLSIDKLEIGNLSDEQQKSIRGGDEAASRFVVGTQCTGNTSAPAGSILQGCPTTTSRPATSSVMTCPTTTRPNVAMSNLC